MTIQTAPALGPDRAAPPRTGLTSAVGGPTSAVSARSGRERTVGLERAVHAEIVAAQRPDRPLRRRLRRARAWIERHPRLQIFYRIGVAIVGTVMAIGGLILVPLPGPGWLIVFLGLAVLGTEFTWARRLATRLGRVLERFWVWWRARRAARQAQRIANRG